MCCDSAVECCLGEWASALRGISKTAMGGVTLSLCVLYLQVKHLAELRVLRVIADPQALAQLPPKEANTTSMSIDADPDSSRLNVDDCQKSH